MSPSTGSRRWTLISNHGGALLYLHRFPGARISDVAEALELTDRSAARILSDLRAAGYIQVRRRGRRNVYEIEPNMPLRHALLREWPIENLLGAFASDR